MPRLRYDDFFGSRRHGRPTFEPLESSKMYLRAHNLTFEDLSRKYVLLQSFHRHRVVAALTLKRRSTTSTEVQLLAVQILQLYVSMLMILNQRLPGSSTHNERRTEGYHLAEANFNLSRHAVPLHEHEWCIVTYFLCLSLLRIGSEVQWRDPNMLRINIERAISRSRVLASGRMAP